MGLFLLGEVAGTGALSEALNASLTADAFFGTIAPFMGTVGKLVLIAFGICTLKHIIKGASKGKANV